MLTLDRMQHWFGACDKFLLLAVLQEGWGNWRGVLAKLSPPATEALHRELQHLAAGSDQPGAALEPYVLLKWLALRTQVC